MIPDLSLIQQEVDALEELSRQLFLETVDLQATKVTHPYEQRGNGPFIHCSRFKKTHIFLVK